MDVFSLRDRVIQDYADYVRSFVQVRDRPIDEFVQKSLRDEVLWPQPLIQLNPSFEPGGWVDDLVDRGLLHAGCRKIFRIKTEEDPIGSRMLLHRHQVEAIEAGRRGQNYVLKTERKGPPTVGHPESWVGPFGFSPCPFLLVPDQRAKLDVCHLGSIWARSLSPNGIAERSFRIKI
jgi:hypothetical protein